MANVFDGVAYLLPNNYTVLCRRGNNLGESWLMTRREFRKTYPGEHWMSPCGIGPSMNKEDKLYLYGDRTVRNYKGKYLGKCIASDHDDVMCVYDGNKTYRYHVLYELDFRIWAKEVEPMSATGIMKVYSNISSHYFQCTKPAFACEAKYDQSTVYHQAQCNTIVYKHLLELYGKETILDLAKILEFGEYTNGNLGFEVARENNGYTYLTGHNFNDKVHRRIHELIEEKDDWTPIVDIKHQAMEEFDAEEYENTFIPRGYRGPLMSIDGEYVGEIVTKEEVPTDE